MTENSPPAIIPISPMEAPERPINLPKDDKLERQKFVQRVASALINKTTKKSTGVVVGITGPWGSGKSSILNLLREHLKNEYSNALIVAFDPWLVSGRNDLISEFLSELIGTINADVKTQKEFKRLGETITEYGANLALLGNLLKPGVGSLLSSGLKELKKRFAEKESLSTLRKNVLKELKAISAPIVVLIDEIDRVEDSEIRTVAQLVRSVVDFQGISYVLAYDQARVIEALGTGAPENKVEERGRLYLEKIVQLQIPLPVTFSEEITRLLTVELKALASESGLPDKFDGDERYRELMQIFTTAVIETPRDIKRLVGTYRVLAGMVGGEVDWIDLLAYSALLIKAPITVNNIARDPGLVTDEIISVVSVAARINRGKQPIDKLLEQIISPSENSEGIRSLVKFLFPSLSKTPKSKYKNPYRLCFRRPLLTTLRLGLIPGSYSKTEVLALLNMNQVEVLAFLQNAMDNGTIESLLDHLDDLYSSHPEVNHVQFWKGVAEFLKKPDCEWQKAYSPMVDISRSFAQLLEIAAIRNPEFKKIALQVFSNLRGNEDVLTPRWIMSHIQIHGLFNWRKERDDGAFLTLDQTHANAVELSHELRPRHLSGKLTPCRWDLMPVYVMKDAGIWDDLCKKKLDEALIEPEAIDGLTLMLFGGNYTVDKPTLEKMLTYDLYIKRVNERLGQDLTGVDISVVAALKKAIGDW